MHQINFQPDLPPVTRWQTIRGTMTCIGVVALSIAMGAAMILVAAYAAWLLWPGAA